MKVFGIIMICVSLILLIVIAIYWNKINKE